jgi:hypothetical protein
MDERIEEARLSYERAVFGGDSSRLPAARALDGVEADRPGAGADLHARFLETRVADATSWRVERVAHLAESGDVAGEGEALFWIGTFHQLSVATMTPRCTLS